MKKISDLFICDNYRFHVSAVFQNEDGLMDYFESVVQMTKAEPRKVIGWVMKELMGNLNLQGLKVAQR